MDSDQIKPQAEQPQAMEEATTGMGTASSEPGPSTSGSQQQQKNEPGLNIDEELSLMFAYGGPDTKENHCDTSDKNKAPDGHVSVSIWGDYEEVIDFSPSYQVYTLCRFEVGKKEYEEMLQKLKVMNEAVHKLNAKCNNLTNMMHVLLNSPDILTCLKSNPARAKAVMKIINSLAKNECSDPASPNNDGYIHLMSTIIQCALNDSANIA